MTMPAFDPFDDQEEDEDDAFAPTSLESACAYCRCTETAPCIGANGLPCHWVTPTLCSACLEV